MATGDFDAYYPQNPWSGIEQNKRAWYVPELYRVWKQQTVYNRLVSTRFNMVPGAATMNFDTILLPNANNDAAGVRDLYGNAAYMDSKRRSIAFSRYNGKFSLNKYEDKVNFWTLDGRAGLANILTGDNGLAYHMVEVNEKLARNAFLANPPRHLYGSLGTATSIGAIATGDVVTTALIDDIILGMKERGVPVQQTGDGSPGSMVCITSPGVLRDLRYELSATGNSQAFVDVMRYQQSIRLINGEVGTYHGVRFVESNRACLYNFGGNKTQTTITASTPVGTGSPNPATTLVDGTEYVGQPSATHSITVASSASFAVGDYVTIHTVRTSAYGTTSGVDFTSGKNLERRIVEIPDSTHISFHEPVSENYITDLGGGVYGYITKARNVHSLLFTAAQGGVVLGVSQAPQVYTPRPVDDFDMIQRFTWDEYVGYNVFEKDAFEVAYVSASNRMTGARYVR